MRKYYVHITGFSFFSESFSFSGCLTLFLVILSIQISLAIDFFIWAPCFISLSAELTWLTTYQEQAIFQRLIVILCSGTALLSWPHRQRAHIVPSRRRVPRKIVRIKKKRLEESDRQGKIHDDLWGTCFLLCHTHYQKHIKMPKF